MKDVKKKRYDISHPPGSRAHRLRGRRVRFEDMKEPPSQ
jgi:hypothetical protein